MNKKTNTIFSRVMVTAFFLLLGTHVIGNVAFAISMSDLKFVAPSYGVAKINGDISTYYFFKTKISANKKS